MDQKLMILIVFACVVCIDTRRLEPSQCQFKKYLVFYYGACTVDETEAEPCLDVCSGEPVIEEEICEDKLECCWDGMQCSLRQIPVQVRRIGKQEKVLNRVRRQSNNNNFSAGVLRLSNNLLKANGAFSHTFSSGANLGVSGSFTEGGGSTAGVQFSNRGFGANVNFNSQNSNPVSVGISYKTNLLNGQLKAIAKHSPGGSTSVGVSFVKTFGK